MQSINPTPLPSQPRNYVRHTEEPMGVFTPPSPQRRLCRTYAPVDLMFPAPVFSYVEMNPGQTVYWTKSPKGQIVGYKVQG